MCGPAAGFLVSAASSVVGFMGEAQQAKAQNQMWKANYRNAVTSAADEFRQTQIRMSQEDTAANQKKDVSLIEQEQKVAEGQVAAAAGGVSGISVNRIIGDVVAKSATNRNIIDTNAMYTAAQLTEEMKGIKAREESRINSVQRATGPNPLALGINIIGAGVKAMQSTQ